MQRLSLSNIFMLNYRAILKNTYLHIKSKRFREYLLEFYRINAKLPLKQEYLSHWCTLLSNISSQQA